MKTKYIDAYMKVAETFADLSSAVRLKVGAIIVKDNRIISIGYNGTPAGWDNACEYEFIHPQTKEPELVTKSIVLHAERNALDKLAKGNEGGLGSSMFVTHAPCLECAKSIYGAGITDVYYKHEYRSSDGLVFLQNCGLNLVKIDA